MATVSVTMPLPLPEAGARVNQLALSLALHVKVPPPVLLMLSVCAAGLAPPCVAVKAKLAGLAPIVGLVGGGVGFELSGIRSGGNPGISELSRRICGEVCVPELEDGAAAAVVETADPISAETFFPELTVAPD